MSEILKELKIGITGTPLSETDKEPIQFAEETGLLIARAGATLVYGTKEGFCVYNPGSECSSVPCNSIAEAACKGAKRVRSGVNIIGENFGKGRRFLLLNSYCDAIISIGESLIVITPGKDVSTELEINETFTPREAVNIAMDKIMARRKAL